MVDASMLQLARSSNEYADCSSGNNPETPLSQGTPDQLREEGSPMWSSPLSRTQEGAAENQKPLTEAQQFEKKQGVTVETKDGKYVYVLKIQGQDKELLTTDATTKGLEKAEAELAKLRREKIAELEKNLQSQFQHRW